MEGNDFSTFKMFSFALHSFSGAPFTHTLTPVDDPTYPQQSKVAREKCAFCNGLASVSQQLLGLTGCKEVYSTVHLQLLWLLAGCYGCLRLAWIKAVCRETLDNRLSRGSETVESATQTTNR